MAEKPTLIEDHALKHFSAAMARFRPPAEAFDPGGAWKSTYEVVECAGLGANAGRAWRIGVLVLEREPLGRDRIRLRLDFRKRAAGGAAASPTARMGASSAAAPSGPACACSSGGRWSSRRTK